MLASDVVTLGAAVLGLLTSIAGSSACLYNSLRTSKINLSILKVKVHNLEILIEKLQQKLNGIDVLKPDPLPWIEQAREFLSRVHISDLEDHLNKKCMNGRVPNVWYQCGAAKSIERKVEAVDVLLENGKEISKETKVKGCKQPEVNIVGRTREEKRKNIWEQVSDDNGAGTVCIYGIAGVGKTAMAVAVHNKALVELTGFENVTWVSVEYGSGLRHIQEEIASKLAVDLSAATDNVERAKTLRSVLMQRRKFLLVLDSMWHAFSLYDIGIPEPTGGCKVIVTSRTYSLCRRLTRKLTSKEFYEIKPLSHIESWELFKGEIGPNILHLESETLGMAKAAVKDLDGLPLAIKMLAETLSETHDEYSSRIDAAWREELFVLRRSTSLLGNKSQELFDCFKCSFENIGEIPFLCFIYCALFPKGHFIKAKELIEYWMWEGLLGQISSLRESLREGRKILNELKDAHLLQNVNEEDTEDSVKMLNLVRQVAVDAIVRSGRRFNIKCGNSLSELPSANEWLKVERASFMHNQLRALSNNPNSKELSTLLLQDNPLHSNHHDYFFSKIRNLKVLDLSRTSISSLPKSLSGLTNLHALLLQNCSSLKRLPSLSNLQKLLVINLSGTPLEQFPEGIHNLTNLRRLDLSHTRLDVIPAKVVGKLRQLEELLLITDYNGGYVWGSNQINPQRMGAFVEELVYLRRLVILQLTFLNPKVFNNYVAITEEQSPQAPLSFRFCIGGFCDDTFIGENSIAVIGDHNIRLPEKTFELHLMFCSEAITSLKFDGCFRDLRVVDVSNFENLMYVFTLEMLGYLRNLKKICVKQCKNMLGIIQPSAEGNPSSITLPEVAKFVLFNLPKLESICHGEVLNCPSLRRLEVWNCHILKLPKVLLGRNNGIIEVRGETEWVEKLRADSPNTNSVLKFSEAPVPPELFLTPRVRRQESFAAHSSLQQRSGRSFGFSAVSFLRSDTGKGEATSQAETRSISALSRLVYRVGGLAFSNSAGSLHIASTTTDISEDSASTRTDDEQLRKGINRTSSSRSDS